MDSQRCVCQQMISVREYQSCLWQVLTNAYQSINEDVRIGWSAVGSRSLLSQVSLLASFLHYQLTDISQQISSPYHNSLRFLSKRFAKNYFPKTFTVMPLQFFSSLYLGTITLQSYFVCKCTEPFLLKPFTFL